MKTNLENLTSLLCECEEVNKQIKELKFWTLISVDWLVWKFLKETTWWITQFFINSLCYSDDNTDNPEIKIIWNPIEYHHLMTYCVNKWFRFNISDSYINLYSKDFTEACVIKIEYSKSLHQQSEETLWQIYNFLKW